MCPIDLAKHLQKEIKNLEKPDQMRTEISDWIARDDKNRSGGLLASLKEWSEDYAQEEAEEDPWQEEELQEELKNSLGEELFAAVIKKGFLNARKGGKKGKGKGKGKCFKCNGEHFIADCPSASPEEKAAVKEKLLEKGKAKAAGKAAAAAGPKGGKQGAPVFPTASQWRGMYPGPTQAM